MISQRQATAEVVLACLLIFFYALFVSGCSTIQVPALTDYSDTGAVANAYGVLKVWDTSGSDLLSYGGETSAMGLTVGALFAASSGAPQVTGLAFGAAMLQGIRSIFKSTDHANALDEGSEMVRAALARYFTTRTAAGISKTPTDCMTAYAGVLASDIQDAINVVSRLDKKRRPPDPAKSDASGQKTANVNNCGR